MGPSAREPLALATSCDPSRGWLRALRRRRRTLTGGLLVYVVLLVAGTAVHGAHHGSRPGLASACPVLSAAEQLPWTPAEAPPVVVRLAGSTPAAPAPVVVRQPGRPPSRERDRAPPRLRLALAI